MNMKLIKTKIKNLNLYEHRTLELDFFAEKRTSSAEKEDLVVSQLFNNIYKLNTIAFAGINASGKTTTLRIIADIIKVYIQNTSISETNNLANFFDDKLEIENILTDGEIIYKIHSIIKKNRNNELYFHEEFLNEIPVTTKINKSNLEEAFNNSKQEIRSKIDSKFLKAEDTMFSAILNQSDYTAVFDLLSLTNLNYPVFAKELRMSYINYLDPSIESFKVITKNDKKTDFTNQRYLIKFIGESKEIAADANQLQNYLSSGTIKGINILVSANMVLQTGGYLLLDEIENHLNKNIVINLINLFTSEMNQNGGTLIFTTHYSEILDSVSRSDGIYLLEKNERISLNKFSTKADIYDRSDKKKSDLIFSGAVTTAPSYKYYMDLKKDLKKSIMKGDV